MADQFGYNQQFSDKPEMWTIDGSALVLADGYSTLALQTAQLQTTGVLKSVVNAGPTSAVHDITEISAGVYKIHLKQTWVQLASCNFQSISVLNYLNPVTNSSNFGFAVLAGTGITNTGTTAIFGDVGTFATTSETGFSTVTVNGVNHAGDVVTQAAKVALTAAYVAAQALPGATIIPTDLNGQVLAPGVYASTAGTFTNTGTLTLDGYGSTTGKWIFQAASTLITSSSSTMVLENGASAGQVVWAVGSSATLGTSSTLVGTILALTSITANTSAVVLGSLLAQNGAVTLAGNTITANDYVPCVEIQVMCQTVGNSLFGPGLPELQFIQFETLVNEVVAAPPALSGVFFQLRLKNSSA